MTNYKFTKSYDPDRMHTDYILEYDGKYVKICVFDFDKKRYSDSMILKKLKKVFRGKLL